VNVLFVPLARAIAQLSDSTFLGVLIRSLVWSVACFAVLHVVVIWAVHDLLDLRGWVGWASDALGTIGASLLAFWLFLPVAAAIGTLYLDRIANAVERRYYPGLPPATAAPITTQIWAGLILAWRILLLNLLALVLALLLPGIGLVLAWGIAAYAIGRGLFVAVAMRRMSRSQAEATYAANRGLILAQGAAMALAGYLPLFNLLVPLLGTAAMVHVLDGILVSPRLHRDTHADRCG
jgi:CysZ protein